MQLYNLGKIPWQESQLIYHALAELGREALCLLSPASPYVCVGYHQDIKKEVFLDYCHENHIPVFRRKVGGGTVYLDGQQLFFQLILRHDNPIVPKKKEAFYRKFLLPIINVYRQIGIEAEYKPVNDVIVESRKISGSGVGEIGKCIVFVGNIILDFNYKMMVRILRVPDEKFRDKVEKTLWEHLTNIRREIGNKEALLLNESMLCDLMVKEFEKLLGRLDPCSIDAKLQAKMEELGAVMNSLAWLYQKGKRVLQRSVKIRSGVTVRHNMHKAPGGLIRIDFKMIDGKFSDISISGDFFCYPLDAIKLLESDLEGKTSTEVREALTHFYNRRDIETPGICVDDWMEVLKV